MQTAKRLEGIGEYYFSQKLREIEQLNREGKNIINLGIGSPDQPPHPDVIRELQEKSALANVHAYQSYKGSPLLRKAISDWYANWYQVTLDPETEILPLMGSKEGIMHICMTYLDEGDQALVPNPGYPTYRSAVKLAGGTCVEYRLTEASGWIPDLHQLEQTQDMQRIKLMFVNYPHMPSGSIPDPAVFQELIAFAGRNRILLVHDNPYSFILTEKPVSLLNVPGAMEVAVELNSLSKSQNMAGWRVGMLCGKKERIDEVLRFKSNMDSGMFLPLQLAAAKALALDQSWYDSVNRIYAERRTVACELLDFLGCDYTHKQAGMFIWAKIPEQYASGYELSDAVLYNANVFITPGGIFGDAGDQYIRVSLCSSLEKFRESLERISVSHKAGNLHV